MNPLRSLAAGMVVLSLTIFGVGGVFGSDIYDYCVFGQKGVHVDPNVTISGLMGSNGNMVILGGARTKSIEGGGALSIGVNAKIDGNTVFNGDSTLGGGTKVYGNVDS